MLDWDSWSGKVAPEKLDGEQPPVGNKWGGEVLGFDIDGIGWMLTFLGPLSCVAHYTICDWQSNVDVNWVWADRWKECGFGGQKVGKRYDLTRYPVENVEGHYRSISSIRRSPKMDELQACRFSSESSRFMNKWGICPQPHLATIVYK